MLCSHVTLLLCGMTVVYAENKNVCTTKTCKNTAQQFSKNMDRSVDPCLDFYGFACGKFVKETVIAKAQVQVSSFTKITTSVEKQLKKILNKTSDISEKIIDKTPKTYYALCMDEAAINSRGLKPAVEILAKAGGWPVLEKNWKDDNWNYLNTEIWLQTVAGGTGLLEIDVRNDADDPSKRIISIDQPTLSPRREYLEEGNRNKAVQAYQKLLVDLAVAFGADRQTANKEQKETIQFMIELAKITTKSEERRDFSKQNSHLSLAQLKQRWGWLDWQRLLNAMMPQGMAPLAETEQVVIGEPSYLTKLDHLLKQSSNRTVANYMMGEAALTMGYYLSKKVENMLQMVSRVITGVQSKGPRWKRCLGEVSRFFHIALSSLYVKHYFNKQSKKDASDIVQKIRGEMLKVLNEVTWMDIKTKKLAAKKALQIQQFIGYPPELLEDKELECYYNNLRMNESHYLEAMMDATRWSRQKSWHQLRQPASRSDWRIHADVKEVNAWYTPLANSIDIPASILQSPFFNNKLPQYLNLATMGVVAGHELTHGFDDMGRQYDAVGRLRNWWDKESLEQFINKKQCVIEQYSSFNDTKQSLLKVNGINVQGEALADGGGLKLAYRVFKNLQELHEPSLPGFEQYTNEQMFFISYANLWCTKTRNESMQFLILTDPHPPSEFRVKGTLQNFQPFSQAFSCSVDSAMNPEKKCQVW